MRIGCAALFSAILVVLMAAPGHALAERAQDGDVVVSLNGGVAPLELPRDHAVPVSVHMAGEILTEDGAPLPRLEEVRLELAGSGRLSTRGLPRCPGGRLRNADNHQALGRCGDALVGTGLLRAMIFLPEQAGFSLQAHLLAFNGTYRGRPAIWMHVFSYAPPISLAVPFTIEPGEGGFHTALVATLPDWTGPYPHLASFDLTLSRRFYRGRRRHSYASASCPVPQPFTAGFLAFARGTFSFADQRQLEVEAVRSCRAS